MFTLSKNRPNEIRICIEDIKGDFPMEEYEKAVKAFENLINISFSESQFNEKEFDEKLNHTEIYDWDKKDNELEDFLKKICLVEGKYDSEDSLDALIDKAGVGKLPEGDYKHFLLFYLVECNKRSEIIKNYLINQVLPDSIFKEYAEEQTNNGNGDGDYVDEQFVQLDWHTLNNRQSLFNYDYTTSVKFVGEAGLGKTTQMMRLYTKVLKDVKEKDLKIIPVWIKMKDIRNADKSIDEIIIEELGKDNKFYELLLENNAIALFFDGYNEVVLPKEEQDNVRRKIKDEIETIHGGYPGVMIAITDRRERSNPPIFVDDKSRGVITYTCDGLLGEDSVLEYVRKKDEKIEAVTKAYLESAEGKWFLSDYRIPAQVNKLIELMVENDFPKDIDDFYDKYLDRMLSREEGKGETRLLSFKHFLHILAMELGHYSVPMPVGEILGLWLENGGATEVEQLFNLAIELPILVPSDEDDFYEFANKVYFFKAENEWT